MLNTPAFLPANHTLTELSQLSQGFRRSCSEAEAAHAAYRGKDQPSAPQRQCHDSSSAIQRPRTPLGTCRQHQYRQEYNATLQACTTANRSRTSPSHLLLYRVVFSIPIRNYLAQPLCANCKADLPTADAAMTSSRLPKAVMTSSRQCQENINRPSQLRRSAVIPPRRNVAKSARI